MRLGRSMIAAAAAGLLWASMPAAPAAAEYSDAWITTKTKMALLTTEDVSSTSINVDTVDAIVSLHGKVQTEAEKQKAGAVAKDISGVKEVKNLLQVVPPAAADKVAVADDQLKDRVEKALAADKSLKDSSIDVQSVNNGVVLLAGSAKTLSDHLRALEVARAVPGVRKVTTEVQSPDKLADAELRDNKGGAASQTGEALSDAWITSAVKLRLLANSKTPALDINVDTTDGTVTLFGIVPSQEAKTQAEAEAIKVSGVRKVSNDLQVVPKGMQSTVEVKDDELAKKVNDAMDTREGLKNADIDVEVKNGIARLTGKVPNDSQRLMAAITARSVPGVRAVQDDLRVEPKG